MPARPPTGVYERIDLMSNLFPINYDLLAQSRSALSQHHRLFWMVGASGAGKSTICRALGERLGWSVMDMDAHIYGDWHGRFDSVRHPVNRAWAEAENGLGWLLALSWEEFDAFNRAALAEYVDLLVEDLGAQGKTGLLIDGGICNPALLAQCVPSEQIICLAVPGRSSAQVWTEDAERFTMRSFMDHLPDPAAAWAKFLDFDDRIADALLRECAAAQIPVILRGQGEAVAKTVERVVRVMEHNK